MYVHQQQENVFTSAQCFQCWQWQPIFVSSSSVQYPLHVLSCPTKEGSNIKSAEKDTDLLFKTKWIGEIENKGRQIDKTIHVVLSMKLLLKLF